MNSVALSVGLYAPFVATVCRSFRSCLSLKAPVEAANPSVAWPRSVAQPGSASGLGKVALGAFSIGFSNSSNAFTRSPWYSAWDFLRAGLQREGMA